MLINPIKQMTYSKVIRLIEVILILTGIYAIFAFTRMSINKDMKISTITENENERTLTNIVRTNIGKEQFNIDNLQIDTGNKRIKADNIQTNISRIQDEKLLKRTKIFKKLLMDKLDQADVPVNQVVKTRSKFHRVSGIVNIYNISKSQIVNTSLCIDTRTPSVFTMCTWELDKDAWVSKDIHNTGQWEPLVTQTIYDVLNQGRKMTFIDIGANMGYFSLLAASIGHDVVSVEPWDQHIQKLVHSIHINKFENKITIVNNAISNSRRELHFYVPWPNNQGAARLVLGNQNVENNQRFSANSITLNDLANLIQTKDIVMKIDIEGHECRALEKADVIFDRFNVIFISMEWVVMRLYRDKYGTACPPENIQKMLEMLTRRGFVPYSFRNNIQLDPYESDKWMYDDIYWKPRPF
ncbi:uncharacterized protein LOC123539099 [Mercenaria mercenaria]|uniref:uncharacterized protein LOC123539099 n=1 Tax=Mercenaria mercenaria TaxID=6596 RepID=UPI00234F1BFA|nr:uncharacterized protein LOC123539099 [Mercenaria mercenaria]